MATSERPGKMPPISRALKYITNSLGACVLNPLKISLKTGRFQNNPRQFDVHYVKETPREVGVNLTNGYNGHLTSREAGSVGGQMVKKMIEAYEQGLQ